MAWLSGLGILSCFGRVVKHGRRTPLLREEGRPGCPDIVSRYMLGYNIDMAWENLEKRLQKGLPLRVSLAAGDIWLPETHINVDEWLTSLAETDEELRELNIPRMRFLQNRWPVELLLKMEWRNDKFSARLIWAVHVRNRTYLILYDGFDYHLIGAIEPGDSIALYQAVLARLLRDRNFVPEPPTTIKSRHPHFSLSAAAAGTEGGPGPTASTPTKRSYLSDLLVGWIGDWIEFPVVGFYHEDATERARQDSTKQVA
jgi:hypothetical protein